MAESADLRRRYTLMLAIALLLLAAAVVLFVRMGSGLTRWLVVLSGLSLVGVYWELRRALPPEQ